MEHQLQVEIVYSQNFEELMLERFRKDWTLHLLCTAGEGTFVFKDKVYAIRKNDCAVISYTNLITALHAGEGLQVEFVAAPMSFLSSQLPANNYSIIGCLRLYDNPVMPLTEREAACLLADLRHIRERMGEPHGFYRELMGSLLRVMMYDLFSFQSRMQEHEGATDRTSYVVKNFLRLLLAGESRQHREVAYFAESLNVSAKYLSDTVKRMTGESVNHLIDRYTLPILVEFLEDDRLSLNQISDEMNFSSLSYFSRYCTKHLGMSPSRYRASSQQHGSKIVEGQRSVEDKHPASG